MAVDMFLKLDGIAGGSTNAAHKDEIEILSFSWGVSNSAPVAATGGGGAGKALAGDASFVIRSSLAAPPLFLACATGKHIKSGIFVIENPAAQRAFRFYQLSLTDILVSSFQSGGSNADVPFDSFSLAYRTLRVRFNEASPTGAVGRFTDAAFDFVHNVKV